jgi:simple sugar transport system substrate-binding protein
MKQTGARDLAAVKEKLQTNPKFKARLAEYGLEPRYGPRHINSGPGFITRENIGKVDKYAGQFR